MSTNSQNNISSGEYFYLIFIAIFCLLKAFGFYEGQMIFTAGMILALVFFLLKLVQTKMSIPEWAAVIVLLGIGGLVYFNTGEKSLLVNFAVLAGMKDVSQRRIFRTGLVCWGFGYVILTFLSLAGLHSDTIFMHNKRGIGYVICHSLGYAHSNVLAVNYLCICTMILYLVKDAFSKRQKAVLTGILAALCLYVFLYAVSFTGLIASFLFFAIYLYLTARGHLSKAEGIIAELILPLCLLFSLVGPLVIKGRLFDLINNALNTRYNLTRWFFQNQPITLFGTRMNLPNYRYTLDCSYAYLFMRLGVIPFAVLMVLYIGTIHRLVKEQRLTELAVMLGLCIAGVTEPFLFNLSFKNVTLIFVGEFLFAALNHFQAVSEKNAEGVLNEEKMSRKMTVPGGNRSNTGTDSLKGRRQKRILLSGKTVPGKWLITDRISKGFRKLSGVWRKNVLLYLLVFFLSFFAVSLIYTRAVPPAQIVFINSSVNEESEKDREHMLLPEEEVQSLRKAGNIVLGYQGPDDPMYPYTGTTAVIEYDRRVVSWGLWTGGAVMLLVLIVSTIRSGGNSLPAERNP